MAEQKFEISLTQANAIMKYLVQQPYLQVSSLIDTLQRLQPIGGEKEATPKLPSPPNLKLKKSKAEPKQEKASEETGS